MKNTIVAIYLLLYICFVSFSNPSHTIKCNSQACFGQYEGPEFVNGSDIAHQFSNKMSAKVGYKLKELFKEKKYSVVDMEQIEMLTKGMGIGQVTYYLKIPFKQVKTECEAFTSFDHVGGWNHKPALEARKRQLNKALLPNQTLDISDLKTTTEGLQEYWIQWKNRNTQAMCK